jgi:hypothetical protein
MHAQKIKRQTQDLKQDPRTRLSLALQIIAQGQEIDKSQSGFIGPALQRLQTLAVQLMQSSFNSSEKKMVPLLLGFTQLMLEATFFTTAFLAEEKKRPTSPDDPVTIRKATLLRRTLGLTFVFHSHLPASAFLHFAQGLGLTKENQERVQNSGMGLLLALLLLLDEQEEFFTTFKQFLPPVLDSLPQAFQEAHAQHLIDDSQLSLALNQMIQIRQACETFDLNATQQVLKDSLEILGVSYQELTHDLQRLQTWGTQLNKSLKNIFYQSKSKTFLMRVA